MNPDKSVLGLATIRRNRGISLEQIAEATKISLQNLHAIEEGEFRKLPGGIYNTNYIKQYARAIDFDEATLLDYYHRAMPPAAGAAGPGKRHGEKAWLSGLRSPRSVNGLS